MPRDAHKCEGQGECCNSGGFQSQQWPEKPHRKKFRKKKKIGFYRKHKMKKRINMKKKRGCKEESNRRSLNIIPSVFLKTLCDTLSHFMKEEKILNKYL